MDTYIFQLLVSKHAIALEAKGLIHSGGSVRMKWARRFRMEGRPSHEEVIARINLELEKLNDPNPKRI